MWQAEADTDLTLSTLPTVAVGQMLLTMAKFYLNTVRKDIFRNPFFLEDWCGPVCLSGQRYRIIKTVQNPSLVFQRIAKNHEEKNYTKNLHVQGK